MTGVRRSVQTVYGTYYTSGAGCDGLNYLHLATVQASVIWTQKSTHHDRQL